MSNNDHAVFRMVFEGWQFELFKSITESSDGYLKIDIDSEKMPQLKGKLFELYLSDTKVISEILNDNESIFRVIFPQKNKINPHDICLKMK